MLTQLLEKVLPEALTQSRIWSIFFGSPLDAVLKGVFRLLSSMQRITLDLVSHLIVLRGSHPSWWCWQQPFSTEKPELKEIWEMGNEWKGRLIKHCLENVYQILPQNAVVCLSFDTLLFVIISWVYFTRLDPFWRCLNSHKHFANTDIFMPTHL